MAVLISRREFHSMLLAAGACSALPAVSQYKTGPTFAHPGMLHSADDLARMRQAVKSQSQPIYAGFQRFAGDPGSQLTYVPTGAFEEIGRNPNLHFIEFDRDANAAYQCALMWTITGDHAYAKLAIGIVNSWSATLKRITGADAVLCAALGGFKIANAAELLRYTESGWSPADAAGFAQLMQQVFLPVIQNFAPFANGNWDTAAIKLMMAIAIYTEDPGLFARAVEYYRHGCGDGRLTHYVYANGQCQESGRDQQHTQLGLAHLGDACEMAWHQGLDLYAEAQNRLLAGFEYTAKYELGETVPFIPDVDQTGKYRHSVISERSALRSVYEQIYNHYVHRMHMAAPWTEKAAAKLRPEGAPFQADATGFGTLLYTRSPGPNSIAAALQSRNTIVHAQSDDHAVTLDWVALRGATQYEILRAETASASFRTIARGLQQTSFSDTTAVAGKLYAYKVRTANATDSAHVSQMRGLPAGWRPQTAAKPTGPTAASCSGSAFRLSAGGAKPVEDGGTFFSIDHALAPGDVLTACLSPAIASGFLSVGLLIRSATAEFLLLISPRGGQRERPTWSVSLLRSGAPAQSLGSHALQAPVITYGRISQPLWLRLSTAHGTLRAASSPDGSTWSEVGSAPAPDGDLRAGMFVASGIEGVTSEVLFEQVSLHSVA